jgi:ribosomal protein L35
MATTFMKCLIRKNVTTLSGNKRVVSSPLMNNIYKNYKNNNIVTDTFSGSYGGSSIGCTSNSHNIFVHQIRTIKTNSSAKKRFLKRGNGSIKRWKQGRRHLNYNQRRKKLLQSLSSVQLKTCDKKVMRKLLNCKIK